MLPISDMQGRQALQNFDPSSKKGLIEKAFKWVEKKIDSIFKTKLEILQKKETTLINKLDKVSADYDTAYNYASDLANWDGTFIDLQDKADQKKMKIHEKLWSLEKEIVKIAPPKPPVLEEIDEKGIDENKISKEKEKELTTLFNKHYQLTSNLNSLLDLSSDLKVALGRNC